MQALIPASASKINKLPRKQLFYTLSQDFGDSITAMTLTTTM